MKRKNRRASTTEFLITLTAAVLTIKMEIVWAKPASIDMNKIVPIDTSVSDFNNFQIGFFTLLYTTGY
jgi:hypothetical protein